MIDVLLSHGADINLKSDWWAGAWGLLETADPSAAAFPHDRDRGPANPRLRHAHDARAEHDSAASDFHGHKRDALAARPRHR